MEKGIYRVTGAFSIGLSADHLDRMDSGIHYNQRTYLLRIR